MLRPFAFLYQQSLRVAGYLVSIFQAKESLMAEHKIRFDDGAAYERTMGAWSTLAGEIFLEWIAPRPGLRWVDVGCGNGAFTELVVEKCAPTEVQGIDPSEGQLKYARGWRRRSRPSRGAEGIYASARAARLGDDAEQAHAMSCFAGQAPENVAHCRIQEFCSACPFGTVRAHCASRGSFEPTLF